jgi:hypothetical protein
MSYTWTITPHLGDVDAVDHATDGASHLIPEYQASPRMRDWIDAYLEQVDSLEDVALELLAMRSVYTAEGVQLDTIGDIVQQPRGDLGDDEYRVFLIGKIYANFADGQMPQIYHLLVTLLKHETVQIHEYWPAAIAVYADGVIYHDTINRLLYLMVGGGINYTFEFSAVSHANAFVFSNVVDAEGSNPNQGMGPMNAETGTGGKISGTRGRVSL